MMKKFISLTLSIFLTSFIILAQPTLTPSWIGDFDELVATQVAETAPDPGPSGANVTWNFSTVVPEDTIPNVNFTYVDPSATPYFAMFPEANLALKAEILDAYTYWKFSSEKLELLGNAFSNFSQVYSNPKTEMVFPFGYTDSFMDTYDAEIEVAGLISYISGSTTDQADAYGTIILPGKTLNNVLRIKSVEEDLDSIAIAADIYTLNYTMRTVYTWVTSNYPGPIASHVSSEGWNFTVFPGIPTDTTEMPLITTFSYDGSDISSGISELSNYIGIQVGPNPFVNEVKLTFELSETDDWLISVFDIQGRKISSEAHSLGMGKQALNLHIPEQLNVCLIYIESEKYGRHIEKLIRM
jgi:hypothetical protein